MIEAFSEELEPKLITDYADISDWAGKLVGSTVRIAALLCKAETKMVYDFLDMLEPLVVSGDVMERAICIGKYFIEHVRSAFSLLGADEGITKGRLISCPFLLTKGENYDIILIEI